ncbi:MAG TPA: alanine--tRNA ligase, partial [Vicinamibacterales bacterium]
GDTGPCGPCSEIFYDHGEHIPGGPPGSPDQDGDRFIEIWNLVFMQFEQVDKETRRPLPRPSIDTGMGLERIAAVMRGTLSNYDTDVFAPLLTAIDQEAGGSGNFPSELATSMTPRAISTRVVADHLRAMTFLIADGVLPSNEWRGYVLRKIMRRAMRHGRRLGLTEPFLYRLADVLVGHMGDAYPELRSGRDTIVQVIRAEEARFDAVLTGGLPRLEELLDTAAASGGVVPGDEAFRLYDTWGLPLDFIEDLASERRLAFDREGFDRAMEAQREKARAKSAFETRRADEPQFADEAAAAALRAAGDVFEGYTTTTVSGARVLALFDAERRQVRTLPSGADGYVLLDRTPFYLEAGGQVSDRGDLRNEAGAVIAQVNGVVRLGAGLPRAHRVTALDELAEGQVVTAHVDEALRDATRRNHTATHLLHAALRQVLGPHVKQAGSLVAPDRLRFDFTHFAPLTGAQLREIERLVNEQILRNTGVTTEIRPLEDAIAAGAMALFGEKYGDQVRVVSIPGFSMELCGGTHVRATGDIGLFTLVQESGVAAGVRRIEALTGEGALSAVQRQREALEAATRTLNVSENQLPDAIARLQQDVRRLAREVQDLKVRLAAGTGHGAATNGDTVDINGVKAVFRAVSGLDKHALRELSDTVKQQIRSGVVVLASDSGEGKVAIVATVTPDLKGRLHAGNIVKALAPIVGGGGGGRPDFAEAGGRDASKIDAMLAEGRAVVEKMLAK